MAAVRLEDLLEGVSLRGGKTGEAVARTIAALAEAGRDIAELIADGPLAGDLAAHRADSAHGDTQKELDLRTDAIVREALRTAPVAVMASEEMDDPLPLRPGAPLAVAIDPLDGSSNIDTNAPVGTIFSILPMPERDRNQSPFSSERAVDKAHTTSPSRGEVGRRSRPGGGEQGCQPNATPPRLAGGSPTLPLKGRVELPQHAANGDSATGHLLAPFFQGGGAQLAAGFLIYGPQVALVLSVGEGTQIFTLDRKRGAFLLTAHRLRVPPTTREYAINGSNERHWDEAVRLYVEDCRLGSAGPRGVDFNTRWIASMVAEAFRILMRGGIYLYPGDARQGYGQGRLRLIYEANPIAFLLEQAGGAATNGAERILDLQPTSLHQRVPLVFGSREEVARVARYHTDPMSLAARSPLFGSRSLFRA
ncbi:class 1 fructose-1,6-bisphosphatase [Chelatococcus sp. GCM10030263]|uniref:class 1 fructose-bisphosphatase n=1 Tax=Chelatococcus sp. GCM10030263 TaxID=3273387 RepID=UPI003611A1CE